MSGEMFPKEFTESTERMLGRDGARQLLAALDGVPTVSVRFNPYKLSEKPEGRQVPWNRYGFYLDERPVFTLDPLFHGGAYYVQEASSMFVEHIFRSIFPEDVEGLSILDLCAAPGGKTTLLSTIAGLESVVVANEVIRQRAVTLADNVRKWGLGNVLVTNNDPSHFAQLRHCFDVMLVDAPCSGEGMFRKNPDSRGEWSPENVKLCAARQRRILSDAWETLKLGGVLIYSTCTFNRQENEENMEWLVREFACEPVAVDVDPSWGIVAGEVAGGIDTFRFYPHLAQGEGFFTAVVRKADGKARPKMPRPRRTVFTDAPKQSFKELSRWVQQPGFMKFASIGDNVYGCYMAAFSQIKVLSEVLTAIYSGVHMGQMFHGKLKPEHPLALFHDFNKDVAPEACLDLEQTLDYLRKKDIDADLLAEGLNIINYQGLPIGWAKRINRRVNNMYPKELRIVNL